MLLDPFIGLQPLGETEVFSLKDGARPPSEAELRKKLTPGAFWMHVVHLDLVLLLRCQLAHGIIMLLLRQHVGVSVLTLDEAGRPALWPVACLVVVVICCTFRIHHLFMPLCKTGSVLVAWLLRPVAPFTVPSSCCAEETCALEACYVAAFRMKQRGLMLHEKLDKAAVSDD